MGSPREPASERERQSQIHFAVFGPRNERSAKGGKRVEEREGKEELIFVYAFRTQVYAELTENIKLPYCYHCGVNNATAVRDI